MSGRDAEHPRVTSAREIILGFMFRAFVVALHPQEGDAQYTGRPPVTHLRAPSLAQADPPGAIVVLTVAVQLHASRGSVHANAP